MFILLLDVIEVYNQWVDDGCLELKLLQSLKVFTEFLSHCSWDDICHFYGSKLEYEGQVVCVLDILLDCFPLNPGTQKRLNALASWIYQTDLTLTYQNKKLPAIAQPTDTVSYFDIRSLTNIFHFLPFKVSSTFLQRLENFEQQVKTKAHFDSVLFQEFLRFISSSWQEITGSQDSLALVAEREYKSFWRYIIHRFAPSWQQSGKFPTILLYDLLILVDNFYATEGSVDAKQKRKQAVISFLNNLASCPVEDLNYFYSALVEVDGNKCYLLELLIECLHDNASTLANLRLLASWLVKVDGSLVSKRPELDSLYQSMQLGPHFSIGSLTALLEQLIVKPDTDLVRRLNQLIETTRHAATISDQIVSDIRQLYREIWIEKIDTPEDYTRLSRGVNRPLIYLAQCMAGAGYCHGCGLIRMSKNPVRMSEQDLKSALASSHGYVLFDHKIYYVNKEFRAKELPQSNPGDIDRIFPVEFNRLVIATKAQLDSIRVLTEHTLNHPNYYKLLIPTLTQDIDPISKDPVTFHPLTRSILSDRNNELIFLPNCEQHYENYRTFNNPNGVESKPLTTRERQRVQHSAKRFVDCFNRSQQSQSNFGLSKTTIEKLKFMVRRVPAQGLIEGYTYTEEELNSSHAGYNHFIEYMHGLPEDEKRDLHQHPINLHGREYTFLEVFQIIVNQGDCEAKWGKYFIQLVLDYDRNASFDSSLELLAAIATMRRCSARRLWREYAILSNEEVIQRILTIMVSLMTHAFQYIPLTGKSINILDCHNIVTTSGLDIFNKLYPLIEQGTLGAARELYASLIETVVIPALDAGPLKRFADTNDWLRNIRDETLFKPENKVCFDLPHLLVGLWRLAKVNPKLKLKFEPFIELLVQSLTQNTNPHLQWIRLNIKFLQLLKTMGPNESIILQALRKITDPIPQTVLMSTIRDFLVQRQVNQYHELRQSVGFFSASRSSPTVSTEGYRTMLEDELTLAPENESNSVKELITEIQKASLRVLQRDSHDLKSTRRTSSAVT
jgi:hypothetical protein